jgi:hypothetical protein
MKIRTIATRRSERRVEYWFDGSPGVRSWVAITADAEGNQIGDATYVGTYEGVIRDVAGRITNIEEGPEK